MLGLSKFRGPGSVTFSSERPAIETAEFAAPAHTVFHGKAVTTATFSEPGEYVLRVRPTIGRAKAGAASSAAGRMPR